MQLFKLEGHCGNDFKEGDFGFNLESCKRICSSDPSCTFVSFKQSTKYCGRYNGATCKIKTAKEWVVYMKRGMYMSP